MKNVKIKTRIIKSLVEEENPSGNIVIDYLQHLVYSIW